MRRFLGCFLLLAIPYLFFSTNSAFSYQNFSVNGSTYPFPDVGDQDWGNSVSNWAEAVSSTTFQKVGGTFTLTNEAYFGPDYGIKAKSFEGDGSLLTNLSTGTLANAADVAASTANLTNRVDALDLSTASLTSVNDIQTERLNSLDLSTAATILTANNTNYVELSGSTQTKTGGLNIGGTLAATALEGDGSGITNIGGFVTLNATQTFTGGNTFNLNEVNVTSNVIVSGDVVVGGKSMADAALLSSTQTFTGGNTFANVELNVSTNVNVTGDIVSSGSLYSVNFDSNSGVGHGHTGTFNDGPQIDTDGLFDNAVTTFTAGTNYPYFAITGVTIASTTITTTGNPVIIMITAEFAINADASGNTYANVNVYRDGSGGTTIIGNRVNIGNRGFTLNDRQFYHVPLITYETPSAGTYTYNLTVAIVDGTLQGVITGNILVVELKK